MKFMEVLTSEDKIDFDRLLVNGKKKFTGTVSEFVSANFRIVRNPKEPFYKNKKTLSNKMMRARIDNGDGEVILVCEETQDLYDTDEPVLTIQDTKEALKEFINWLKDTDGNVWHRAEDKAKEIFGKELI